MTISTAVPTAEASTANIFSSTDTPSSPDITPNVKETVWLTPSVKFPNVLNPMLTTACENQT